MFAFVWDCIHCSSNRLANIKEPTPTPTVNQRIESWWGILRRQCVQFWKDIFFFFFSWTKPDAVLLPGIQVIAK